MNQKHSHETMVEALRLVDAGMTQEDVALNLGVLKPNVGNWVRKRRLTGELPLLKSGGGRGKYPTHGYVPVLRVGMETYELLCPEVRAEFLRRQKAREFEVLEGDEDDFTTG